MEEEEGCGGGGDELNKCFKVTVKQEDAAEGGRKTRRNLGSDARPDGNLWQSGDTMEYGRCRSAERVSD